MSAERLLLAIEAATATASVALMRGDALLASRESAAGQQHSERLLPMVDELLVEQGVSLGDVAAFAISIGPGAFTSLRIGLSTVKGLAFGSDAAVIPVSTLEALAEAARGRHAAQGRSPDVLIPALDARREELYAAVYRFGDSAVDPLGDERQGDLPDGVYTPAELVERLPEGGLVVGEGTAIVARELAVADRGRLQLEAEPWSRPDAYAVGRLGLRGLAQGRAVLAADLVPRYLRRAEAEVLRTSERFE